MTRATAPTSGRARLTMALAALVTVVAVVDGAVGNGSLVDSPVALLLAAAVGYALGAWTPVPTAVSGVLLTSVAFTFANQLHFPGEYPVADDLAFYLLLVGAPAVASASVVARARQVRELTALSGRLAAQRARELEAARLEEQQRIELAVHHRIVELMGAIALRADGARRDVDPQSRERALGEVEELARAGLDSLRAALGLLREDAEDTGRVVAVPSTARRHEPPVGWRDVVLPAGVGAAMAVESVVGAAARGSGVANVLASLAVAAPLVARRSHPLPAAAAALLLTLAMSTRLTSPSDMVTGIALLLMASYAVGSHSRGWWRLAGLGILWAGCLAVAVMRPGPVADADGLLPTMVWCALAVAAGMLSAGWAERASRMREIVEDLQRTRDSQKRVAVARQRQVMARDLHDSVAHTLTLVCLNAGAARRVGGTAAHEALATVADASRSGMAELRNGLDALLVPPEGRLEQQNLQRMADALGVELTVGLPDDLSLDAASTSLVHRLLRETVVNTARHAPGASMLARLEQQGDQLVVEVTDDGPGTSAVDLGTGTGLASLASQLEERGGRLEHGPRPRGGWRVRASLPLPVGAVAPPALGAGAAR